MPRDRRIRSGGRTSSKYSRPAINVLTTMNVQHLESLNDQIEDITGVHIEEPTRTRFSIARRRSRWSILTVRALLNRMERGEVARPSKDDQSSKLYTETISPLTRIAPAGGSRTRRRGRRRTRREKRIQKPWQTQEKILIGISPRQPFDALIRRGWRIAQRSTPTSSPFTSREGKLGEEEKILSDDLKLAERLGVKIVTLKGTPPRP